MTRLIFALTVLFVMPCFAAAELGAKLDSEIAKLTARRDELVAAVAACNKKTNTYKITGISTLGATGVGVFANIKLHDAIKNGGTGGKAGRGIADGAEGVDNCALDELCNWERECKRLYDDGAYSSIDTMAEYFKGKYCSDKKYVPFKERDVPGKPDCCCAAVGYPC